MKSVLSSLLAFATVDALNLRCQYYRWDSTEVKYVCKGDENAVTWSEDSATTPNLMYLGEFRTNLGVCQGRCRSDSDCQDGLVCIFRDPTVSVIDNHCANGHVHRFVNYCYYNDDGVQEDFIQQGQEEMPVDQLVYKGEPPFTSKLMECQGDCDTDWNCDFGLNCFKRSDDRQIPGCEGVGIYSVDYCYVPPPDTLVLVMDAEAAIAPSQAGKCEGSCVNDSDCLVGLECFQRTNYEYVPGCRGLGAHATNYCFDPNDLVFPTAMPQVSPTATPTATPTDISQRIIASTDIPTEIPSALPSKFQSSVPSNSPSVIPTIAASSMPSENVSSAPTISESRKPSAYPTSLPSTYLSQGPSGFPSSGPTKEASDGPSHLPSLTPTADTSTLPSEVPSSSPTIITSSSPTVVSSSAPTITLTGEPSAQPSKLPVFESTDSPTFKLSNAPSISSSERPTDIPSSAPSTVVDKSDGFTSTSRPTTASQNVIGDSEVSGSPTNSPNTKVPPLELIPSVTRGPSLDSSLGRSGVPSINPTTVSSSDRQNDILSPNPTSQGVMANPTAVPNSTITMFPTDRPTSVSHSAVDATEPPSNSLPVAPSSTSASPTLLASDQPSMTPNAIETIPDIIAVSGKPTSPPSSGAAPVPISDWPSSVPTSVPIDIIATDTPVAISDTLPTSGSPTIVPSLLSVDNVGEEQAGSTTASPINAPSSASSKSPVPQIPAVPAASPIVQTSRPTIFSERIEGGDRDQPTVLSCNQDPDLRAQNILLELANHDFDMNLRESTMAFYWLISEDVGCPETRNIVQRFTMATLYYSLRGWNCTESNVSCFLSEAHECTWDGVNCNEMAEVSNLRLDDRNLTGSLPNLSGLSSLVELDMDSNMLSGSIPAWFGNLGALEILDLDSNKLSGSIPTELGDSTLLRVIDLDGNQLVGTIPEEIGLLENLYFLQLDFNLLTGSVPSSIAGVQSLEYLSLLGNNFTDPLSIDFCDRQLELYSNCEMCSIAECCTACLSLE